MQAPDLAEQRKVMPEGYTKAQIIGGTKHLGKGSQEGAEN